MLPTPLMLCGMIVITAVDSVRLMSYEPYGARREAMPPSGSSADPTAPEATMKDRLSSVIFRLAALSNNVAQLERTSRELERSAEETAGDERVSRLASYMISLQDKQNVKLQELTQNVTKKLIVLKTHLRDLTVEVQKTRDLATDADSQANPIQRIVKFFSAFQKEPDVSLRFLPLAIVYKANYTLFDMLQFDPSEKNLDKLLALEVSKPKL